MTARKILNKILGYIREEMMTSGSNPQGFSGAAKAEGPTAGFDPVQGKVQKERNLL